MKTDRKESFIFWRLLQKHQSIDEFIINKKQKNPLLQQAGADTEGPGRHV